MPLVLTACGMSHPQLDKIGRGAPHPLERGVYETLNRLWERCSQNWPAYRCFQCGCYSYPFISMNVTLLKSLIALVLVGILFGWSLVSFFRRKSVSSVLQLFGSGCLVAVVLTHVFEV